MGGNIGKVRARNVVAAELVITVRTSACTDLLPEIVVIGEYLAGAHLMEQDPVPIPDQDQFLAAIGSPDLPHQAHHQAFRPQAEHVAGGAPYLFLRIAAARSLQAADADAWHRAVAVKSKRDREQKLPIAAEHQGQLALAVERGD